jgi:hypothetical protein
VRRRVVLFSLAVVAVAAAGGAAVAVAESVSTTPAPAFISRVDRSISDHPTPTIDDRGGGASSGSRHSGSRHSGGADGATHHRDD